MRRLSSILFLTLAFSSCRMLTIDYRIVERYTSSNADFVPPVYIVNEYEFNDNCSLTLINLINSVINASEYNPSLILGLHQNADTLNVAINSINTYNIVKNAAGNEYNTVGVVASDKLNSKGVKVLLFILCKDNNPVFFHKTSRKIKLRPQFHHLQGGEFFANDDRITRIKFKVVGDTVKVQQYLLDGKRLRYEVGNLN